MQRSTPRIILSTIGLLLLGGQGLMAQNLRIRGFFDFNASYREVDDKATFTLGEQDLFLTSKLSDRVDFLGESVFKYVASTQSYTFSMERAIIKYNFSGNHNLIFGKHHTPVNYWNDTYHHGRLFFPTIQRPELRGPQIIPLHTLGIGIHGHDLGAWKFGYNLLVGNGLGSNDWVDDNQIKSITAAVHIKPTDGLRIGASAYYDVIAVGADLHSPRVQHIHHETEQLLLSSSLGYFGEKFELLCEGTYGLNSTDSLSSVPMVAYYGYAGYHIGKKVVLYGRFDQLLFDDSEMFYVKDDLTSMVGGLRFVLGPLTVVKVEFQQRQYEVSGTSNIVSTQFAIGF